MTNKNKYESELPKMKEARGNIHAEMKRCGRDNCCCTRGLLHGPYYNLYYRENGRLRKRYVRKSDVKAMQAQCAAQSSYKAQQRQARQQRRSDEHEAREEYRQLIGTLKQATGGSES